MADRKGRTAAGAGQAPQDELLSTEHREALDALTGAGPALEERLGSATKLETAADLERARAVVLKAKSIIEVGEQTRAAATLPFRKKSDAVVALFKPALDAVKRALDRASNLARDYMVAEHERQLREEEAAERLRREAEERQREAERQARVEQDPDKKAELQRVAAEAFMARESVEAPPREIVGARGSSGSLFVQEEWDFEILDLAAVPREWLTVDREKVEHAARQAASERRALEIAGLRIFAKRDLGSRRRGGS